MQPHKQSRHLPRWPCRRANRTCLYPWEMPTLGYRRAQCNTCYRSLRREMSLWPWVGKEASWTWS